MSILQNVRERAEKRNLEGLAVYADGIIGRILVKNKQLARAEPLIKRSANFAVQRYGWTHPGSLSRMQELADVFRQLDKTAEAVHLFAISSARPKLRLESRIAVRSQLVISLGSA